MKIAKINNQLIAEATCYGKKWGLLFHEFSYWLINNAQQLKLKKLYFFTREGAFFIELVKALQEKFNFYQCECHLLAVSRLASFLPSVDIQSKKPFQRLFAIYPNQSPRSFFISLDIQDPRLQKIYEQDYGGHYDVLIFDIAQHVTFNQFLENASVKSIIENAIIAKKALLTNYLKQNSFLEDQSEPIGIVDIGWRGSIQDNLTLIFPEKKIVGFYLGLHRFKTNLASNHYKKAFLFNGNEENSNVFTCLMRFVLPLEFLCTPAQGSVKHYSIENNTVIPQLQYNKTEKIFIEGIMKIFQQSVLTGLSSYQFSNQYRLKECKKIAKQIVWNPKEFQLFFYQHNQFNETFGYGISAQGYAERATKNNLGTWINSLKKSAWISGYLSNKLPKPLFQILPILYLLYCLLTFDSYLLP